MPTRTVLPNRRAEPLSTSRAPIFPEMMRGTGENGTVLTRIVVDTTGRFQLPPLRVVRTGHQVFEIAVKNSLPRWRFLPAVSRGQLVPDTLDILVTFQGPNLPAALFEFVEVERTSPKTGRWEFVVGAPARDSTASLPDSAAQIASAISMLDTLLAEIVRTNNQSPDRVACVSVDLTGHAQELAVPNLVQLRRNGIAVMNNSRCPRSFASAVFFVDPVSKRSVIPPGEDPFELQIRKLQPFSLSAVSATATISYGLETSEYACFASRDSTTLTGWRARCARTRYWIF